VLESEEVGDGDIAIHGGVAGEGVFDEGVGGGEGLAVEEAGTCARLVLAAGGVGEGFEGGGGGGVFGGGGGDAGGAVPLAIVVGLGDLGGESGGGVVVEEEVVIVEIK